VRHLGWRTDKWATPFSGFRWAVPALAGYQGRAIYCDSDFIFMADLAELWAQKFEPGRVVMGKGGKHWRMCCSMWDCAGAWEHLAEFEQLRSNRESPGTLGKKFGAGSPLVQPFRGDWNNLDARFGEPLGDPSIKAIHYTEMSTQPQLAHAIPRL